MTTFADRLPDLITRLGTSELMPALDRSLAEVAPVDLSCVFVYPLGAPPLLVHDAFNGAATDTALAHYFAGAYLLDCVYTACKKATPAGLYRLADLAPDAFFEGEYFNSPDVHPCISLESGSLDEEIVYLAPLVPGVTAAYSLMRANGSTPFSAAEFAALGAAEPLVRALLVRQFAAVAEATPPPAGQGELEALFDTFKAETLSPRERQIVALILQGHSSTSIAMTLGIAEGTVKIHRKNLYAKLVISSQAELFALFLKHLRGR